LQEAHRRQQRALGLSSFTPPSRQNDSTLWDDRALASLISTTWEQTPQRIAHLLGLDDDIETHGRGKATKASKAAQRLLQEIEASQGRLRAWAENVFEMSWSQAQLLQVMEQIEPYVADALYDEQRLAAAAIGAYAHLGESLEQRLDEESYQRVLLLVGGVDAPEMDMVEALASGVETDAFRRRFGHRGDHEWELAEPRWSERHPPQAMKPRPSAAWDPATAKRRAQDALEETAAQVGWLQRNAFRRHVELTRRLLSAHAYAVDALAYVLAAVRRWSLAAAEEARRDGQRLDEPNQIFWLELEEVKQVMTGEWHSRDQVQPLVKERMAEPRGKPLSRQEQSARLGVAGHFVEAPAQFLNHPEAIATMRADAIALVIETTPIWPGLFLQARGVAAASGHLLCHTAASARAGGVPAVVGAAIPAEKALFRLDPARHQAMPAQ